MLQNLERLPVLGFGISDKRCQTLNRLNVVSKHLQTRRGNPGTKFLCFGSTLLSLGNICIRRKAKRCGGGLFILVTKVHNLQGISDKQKIPQICVTSFMNDEKFAVINLIKMWPLTRYFNHFSFKSLWFFVQSFWNKLLEIKTCSTSLYIFFK